MTDLNSLELRSHIDRLLKSRASATERGMEDLEDYYERALQMRQMRVTTLEEELKEMQTAQDTCRRRARVLLYWCWLLGVLWLLVVGCAVHIARPAVSSAVLGMLGVLFLPLPAAVVLSSVGTWLWLKSGHG